MKQPRILIDTENGQEYRNFDFVIDDAQAVYVIDSDSMGVVIGGSDFILEFNTELFQQIKHNIAIKNNYQRN